MPCLSTCQENNLLAKARGLSPRTGRTTHGITITYYQLHLNLINLIKTSLKTIFSSKSRFLHYNTKNCGFKENFSERQQDLST